MSDRDPILFEHNVRNLLLSMGLQFREEPRLPFDFFVTDRRERRTAIEVKVGRVAQDEIWRIGEALAKNSRLLDQFLLATPQRPTERLSRIFAEVTGQSNLQAHWITANDLPVYLGADVTIDLDSAATAEQLQTAALVSGIGRYSRAPIGRNFWPERGGFQTWLSQIQGHRPQLPRGYDSLARHLSYAALEPLSGQDATQIDRILSLGDRVDDVTVVLSDIRNFSAIVKAARLTKLQGTMAKYYERSRRLVWNHSGTFDKFIGDAVLSFFGYPHPDPRACVNAVRFAMDLVRMGSVVLNELTPRMNDVIETGTRVGVATGEVWVLNTGKDAVEVAFIGDVINLAARLEKSCVTDGVLLDNITKNLVDDEEPDLIARLAPNQVTISPEMAKGQTNQIRAWQIDPAAVTRETGSAEGAAA
jgi:adenylate cyclase